MATKEIDVLELQNDLEAIVDALAPGASIVITKDGKPHARLEKAYESIVGSLAKFVVPGADMSLEALKVMDPEIEAMFEGREFTLLEDHPKP